MATTNKKGTITTLLEEERAFLMGTLLGDGHLQRRTDNKKKRQEGDSYRLKVTQSLKQGEYVFWKHEKLARLCVGVQGPREYPKGEPKPNSKPKVLQFSTSSQPCFGELHRLFYKERFDERQKNYRYDKVITEELIKELPMSEMVLAVWFMDDGSNRGKQDDKGNPPKEGFKLATQGFSKDGNDLLKSYLNKWGIKANVAKHTDASNQFYINILKESHEDFVKLVEPVVSEVPVMLYKLNGQR